MKSPFDELEAERRSRLQDLQKVRGAMKSGVGAGQVEALQQIEAKILEKLSRIQELQLQSNDIAQEQLQAHLDELRKGSERQDARSVVNDRSGPVRDDEAARRRLEKAATVMGHIGRGGTAVAKHVGRRTAQAGRVVASGARGAYNLADQHQATIFFIPVAAFVIFFEFFSVYAGTWPIRVSYYTVIVLLTLIFRDFELTKRAAFAALVVNGVWWLYLTGAGTPGMSAALISPVAKMIATVFILPGFVWYLLYLEPNIEIAKVFRNIGWIPIVGAMIALIYPAMSSAAGLIPTPPTGFDPQPAARDAIGFILGGAGEAVRDLVCYLGIGGGACSTADSWLARITEPFAYDATTVHEIQRHNLGVYIRDAEVDGTVEVTGYSPGSFLPKSIDFTIHAPIPEDLEIELCNARASDLKGFPGICNNTIKVTCTIDGVSTTQIVPRSELSIRTVVVPGLYSCRMQAPADAALNRAGSSVSKRAEIKVEYPFVTTTFKLIRAVDIDRAITREARAELEGFRESRVISSGGPVIVEVSDSEFVRVDGDNTIESLTINLQAQPEVRIEGIDSLYVFIPNGSVLEPYPGDTESYCDFVVGFENINREHEYICQPDRWVGGCTPQEQLCYDRCISPTADGTCPDLQLVRSMGRAASLVEGELGDRDQVNACRASPEELLGTVLSDRPSTVYMLSKSAMERINADLAAQALEADSRRFTIGSRDNSVRIGCQLRITDKNTFLQDEVLVTERAVNIISSYRVSHAQETTVRFAGAIGSSPFVSFSGSHPALADSVCSIEGMSVEIPVGVMPMSGKLTLTDPFGTPRPNSVGYHRGADFVLAGAQVVASWSGIVEYVERSCPNTNDGCGSGYGNRVTIRTTTPEGSFVHIYGHLVNVDSKVKPGVAVKQGQVLGPMGNSGTSTGPHLHFELRGESGVPLNPLFFLPQQHVQNLTRLGDVWPQSVAFKTDRRIECRPVERRTTDLTKVNLTYEDIDQMLSSAGSISNTLGGQADVAKVSLIINAAIERGVPPDILLGIAKQENQFNHEIGLGIRNPAEAQWEGIALSVDRVSLGMMQINSLSASPTYCTDTMYTFKVPEDKDKYAQAQKDIAFNVHCAAEILDDKYDYVAYLLSEYDAYCGRSCSCNRAEVYDQRTLFPPESDQWYAAVKAYNGWGCQNTVAEATNYPDRVFEYANAVLAASDLPLARSKTGDTSPGESS